MMAPLLYDRVTANMPITSCEIRFNLKHYLKGMVSNSFVALICKDAFTDFSGKEHNILRSVPLFMVHLQENGHAAKLVSKSGSEMVEIAISISQSKYEDSLKGLYVQDTIQGFDEKEVREQISSMTDFDAQYAYVLLYSSRAARVMFPRLLTVIIMDATHCTWPK